MLLQKWSVLTTTVEVDGTSYEIEYFLGGDWKFLALVTGKPDLFLVVYW